MISLAGFIIFLRTQAGISIQYLPDDSPYIEDAYCLAKEQVNLWFCRWKTTYPLMVYNLGTHILITIAQDYSVSLSSLTWSSGTITAITSIPNTFVNGNSVIISNSVPAGYNSTQIIQVTTSTQFTYSYVNNPGVNILPGNVGFNLFSMLRSNYHINNFVAGVIKSSADESTSESLETPNWAANLSLNDLDLLKTPFGRFYAMYAQKFGSLSLSGLS